MKRSDWLINKEKPRSSKDAGFMSMLEHEVGTTYVPYGRLMKIDKTVTEQLNTYHIYTPGRTQRHEVVLDVSTGEILRHGSSDETSDGTYLRPRTEGFPSAGGFRDADAAFRQMGATMDQMNDVMDRTFGRSQRAIDNTDLNSLLARASATTWETAQQATTRAGRGIALGPGNSPVSDRVVTTPADPRFEGISQGFADMFRELESTDGLGHTTSTTGAGVSYIVGQEASTRGEMYDRNQVGPARPSMSTTQLMSEPVPPPLRMVREGGPGLFSSIKKWFKR